MDNQPEQPSQPTNTPLSTPSPTTPSPAPTEPDSPSSSTTSSESDVSPSSTSFDPSSPPPFNFAAQSTQATAPKKKRKGWIIALIVAAILVVLGGGGVFAYTWYQAPEKVITDGMMKGLMAKTIKYTGTINMDNELLKLKVDLTGANTLSAADVGGKVTATFMGKEVTTDVNARFDTDGNIYAKINNLDATIKTLTEGVPPEMLTTLDKIVAKINNQWVKITPDNLATVNPESSKAQKCTADALKKYQDDKEAMREVASVYDKNKFVKVSKELGLKDYNLGYELKIEGQTSKNFAKDLENTKIFKTVKECSPELKTKVEEDTTGVDQQVDDTIDSKVEIWLNMWTHEVRKFSAESNAKDGSSHSKAEIVPEFNKDVTIAAPESFVTFEQLQADVDALIKESEAMQKMQAEEILIETDSAYDATT